MDRFKFRAWDKARKIMIGSDYPDNWGNDNDEWWSDNDRICLTAIESASRNDNLILMQCTGLKDKNGKLIYEGDIVDVFDLSNNVSYKRTYIKYERGSLKAKGCKRKFGWCDSYLIIGNLHENSELLNGH